MPRRRSLSSCAVKPRIDEPSKVRLSDALEQELLVVVQHVQPAFEVGEQHGDGLDALLVGQVLQPLLADLIGRHPVHAVGLGLQIEFFKLLIREGKKIAVISRHGSPSGEMSTVGRAGCVRA